MSGYHSHPGYVSATRFPLLDASLGPCHMPYSIPCFGGGFAIVSTGAVCGFRLVSRIWGDDVQFYGALRPHLPIPIRLNVNLFVWGLWKGVGVLKYCLRAM